MYVQFVSLATDYYYYKGTKVLLKFYFIISVKRLDLVLIDESFESSFFYMVPLVAIYYPKYIFFNIYELYFIIINYLIINDLSNEIFVTMLILCIFYNGEKYFI